MSLRHRLYRRWKRFVVAGNRWLPWFFTYPDTGREVFTNDEDTMTGIRELNRLAHSNGDTA